LCANIDLIDHLTNTGNLGRDGLRHLRICNEVFTSSAIDELLLQFAKFEVAIGLS